MTVPIEDGEVVGSLRDEAAKLLAALQTWAGDQAGYAETVAAAMAAAAAQPHDEGEGSHTSCRFCPVCRALDAVRATPPEVREHLSSAVTSLAQAVSVLLATPVPDSDPTGGPAASPGPAAEGPAASPGPAAEGPAASPGPGND